MAVTKRILGSYTLSSINPTDQMTINTSVVTINGNLIVTGNTQQVNVTNSVFSNNFITISSIAGINSGIIVDRSNNPASNVALIWNDTIKAWQVSNNGVTYANIGTVATGTTAIANLYADSSPTLSANLNIKGWAIYNPATGANLSFATPAGGGSGLLVTNTQYSNAELMTETKGIVYSIIFG